MSKSYITHFVGDSNEIIHSLESPNKVDWKTLEELKRFYKCKRVFQSSGNSKKLESNFERVQNYWDSPYKENPIRKTGIDPHKEIYLEEESKKSNKKEESKKEESKNIKSLERILSKLSREELLSLIK